MDPAPSTGTPRGTCGITRHFEEGKT
jgi:hypothetical protein